MKVNSHIFRGIASLLLVVTAYMYVCSGLCAAGSSVGCCGEKTEDTTSHKDCCDHNQNDKTDHQDNDCYTLHSSFFSATGQFASGQTPDGKIIQSVVAILPAAVTMPIEQVQKVFAYTGFHAPPPKTDIRLVIQSFQI